MCREENSKNGQSRDLFKTLKKITGELTPKTGHINFVKSKSDENFTELANMNERWRYNGVHGIMEYTDTLYKYYA